MKRTLIFILTLALALSSLTVTALAVDYGLSMDEYEIDPLKKYIMADPHLVSAYLSNSVTIYNFEDSTCSKTAYFTISNDKIVGMLTVVEYEGEYYSSYALEAPTEIKTAFSTSTPFALGYINDQLAIITQSEITLLSANPDSKTDTFNELNTASVTYTTLIKTDTIIADSPMRATMYMRIHDVRRVPNEGSRRCYLQCKL